MQRAKIRKLVVVMLLVLAFVGSSLPSQISAAGERRDLLSWGQGGRGQMGDGTSMSRVKPTEPSTLVEPTSISAGGSHSLALDVDGRIWSWGSNDAGQLGTGSTAQSNVPRRVSGLSGRTFISISAGSSHSLALEVDGSVWAWGAGTSGQLGIGTLSNRTQPVRVSTMNGAIAVAAGGFHSLAIRSDGTAWAWGSGGYGQLGNGSASTSSAPVQVSTISGAAKVAAGLNHSLAVKIDGTLWAWGRGGTGQLGDGSTANRLTPVQVTSLSQVVSIDGGDQHSLAALSDGSVWGWGYGYYGQFGDGSPLTNSTVPVKGTGISGISAVVAGGNHSMGLGLDGSVWVWGLGSSGQMGNGNANAFNALPMKVPSVTGATAIAAGDNHSVAMGLLPSGQCYGGVQVLEGTALNARDRIYVLVIDPDHIWICVRVSAHYDAGEGPRSTYVGGKFIYTTPVPPDLTRVVTVANSDDCALWIVDHSTLGRRVAIKADDSDLTVCVLAENTWTSVHLDPISAPSLLVEFESDP